MAQLWHKTRGNTDPDRKQKVYFSAHPKDYRLLDSVAAEILEYQNCAVWYDKEPEAEYDENEFASSLEQMQLFVMPVTTRLLTEPCRALEFEFQLAQREHIPVLPLMQEEGLEELFSEKCGDLQFLYKNSRDTTGISYEEKLKKYLEAVLVGEKEAKRIRESFAAYIFLSYRKKDREHAQKLMRLIHKVDFCRDIAIWYDEFLIPGENFTELIRESLDKSRLFVLTVTPNLLEDNNYVMKTEYPLAAKQKKPVLPAELVKTDCTALSAKYSNIPRCVSADDEADLRRSLSEHFSPEDVNNSPEQLYLMGLAYLNGVDVERDEGKALSLITASAEKEHTEALEKLVQMYREGLGVKRDYETAIEWQKKLCSILEKLYGSNDNESGARQQFYALWDLSDYLCELHRFSEAVRCCMNMYRISCVLTEKYSASEIFDTSCDRSFGAMSLRKIGNICRQMGDLEEAREYYRKSLEACQSTEGEISREEENEKAAILSELGSLCMTMGDIEGAKRYYQQAHGICQRAERSMLSRRRLAASYSQLADMRKASGDLKGAYEYYLRAYEICRAAAAEDSSTETQRALSDSCLRLGSLCLMVKLTNCAKEYFEENCNICLSIAAEEDSIHSQQMLSAGFGKLGDLNFTTGDFAKAREYYEKSLGIYLDIAEKSRSMNARHDVSMGYGRLGNVCRDTSDAEGARRYYLKALDIELENVRISETAQSLDNLAFACSNLGMADKRRPDFSDLRRAYDIWERLSREHPKVKRYTVMKEYTEKVLGQQ